MVEASQLPLLPDFDNAYGIAWKDTGGSPYPAYRYPIADSEAAQAGAIYTDARARAAVSTVPTVIDTATYTLLLTDAYGYLRATNAGGCALTVPPESEVAYVLGTTINFRAATSGPVVLVAGAGVTLNPPGGASGSLTFAEEGATVQIKKVDADEWDVIGSTSQN